jgi:ATP-dependent protease ClpP protease subunit
MSTADRPTLDDLKIQIRSTGGEIESITDALADDLDSINEACATRIRSIGAELASAIRASADLLPRPLH